MLILSDGRMGHLKQSIALAKHLSLPYDIVEVKSKYRFSKALSYFLDNFSFKIKGLFKSIKLKKELYTYVVGTGSLTYYMVKILADELKAKSVVMMLPSGYKCDFDLIFAQAHDNPPTKPNIIITPANFAYTQPQAIYTPTKQSIAIIVGGDNKHIKLTKTLLASQLQQIKQQFSEYEIAITTSPRTSQEISDMVESMEFDYSVIYAKNPINPISDFVCKCEYVFITQDSTSMISEAISCGKACVEILTANSTQDNKYTQMLQQLSSQNYIHIYDSKVSRANAKIDFATYAKKAIL
jgi:mitochondrial fission protein ELM1